MRVHIPVVAAALVLVACGHPAPVAEPAAKSVRVAAVDTATLSPPIVVTGVVGAKDELTLAFKIGGVIEQIAVDPGTRVRRGQVLARLAQPEIGAIVTKAEAAAEKAARDVGRAERLYTDSVITLERLQDLRTASEVARADARTARFNEAYAVIRAPDDGVVLRRLAEPNQVIESGKAVLTLAAAGRGTVIRAGLADRDVVRLARGDRAVIRFQALGGAAVEGRVTQIGAAATPGVGTYEVEVALAPTAGSLPLVTGLVGTMELHPGRAERVVLVPLTALIEADAESAAVFVVEAGTARRRRVSIGPVDGARVVVRSGLDGARSVVTEGAAWLTDGAPVQLAATTSVEGR